MARLHVTDRILPTGMHRAEVQWLRSELYDAWVKWAAERRIGAMTVGRFFERIRGSAPYVTTDSYERGGHKLNVFRGLSMKQWAAKQYLGRP